MVTYHNSERIFGFQYIPLSEMDDRLFGNTPGIGEAVFDKAVGMLEAVLEQAAACFPKQVRPQGHIYFQSLTPGLISPSSPCYVRWKHVCLEKFWRYTSNLRTGRVI